MGGPLGVAATLVEAYMGRAARDAFAAMDLTA
jgi:hypothetical protein